MDEDIQQVNTTGKLKPLKSPVWSYFKRVLIDGIYRAQCLENGCTKTLAIPNWSTSPLYKHLREIHKIEDLKKKPNGRGIVGGVIHKLTLTKKKKFDHLALEAIIKDGRSFNDFNKSGLKRFLQYAIPGNKKMLLFVPQNLI